MPEEKRDEKKYEVRAIFRTNDGHENTTGAVLAHRCDAITLAGFITGEMWTSDKYANTCAVHVEVVDKVRGKTIFGVETTLENGTTVTGKMPSDLFLWADTHKEVYEKARERRYE